MHDTSWLIHLGLGRMFVLDLGLLILVSAVAYGAAVRRRKQRGGAARALPDFLPSAILGLLSLLLAFMFSLSAGRFEARRALLVAEADAISTAYLRAQLLNPPADRQIAALLRDHLRCRIQTYEAKWEDGSVQKRLEETRRIDAKIWSVLVPAVARDRTPVTALVISSINEVFDLESQRTLALTFMLPDAVYWLIMVFAASGLASYAIRAGSGGGPWKGAILALSLMFSLLLSVIKDLDSPRRGWIRLDQAPLTSLEQSMRDHRE